MRIFNCVKHHYFEIFKLASSGVLIISAECFAISIPYKTGIILANFGLDSFLCLAVNSETCLENIRAMTAVLCFKSSLAKR